MEEDRKMSYDELKDLMEKIDQAMEMSRSKAKNIENKNNELLNETAILKVENGKEEIAKMDSDKKEFDEMTVVALTGAIQDALRIKEEEEKAYQKELMETAAKYKELDEKLQRMKSRELSDEQLSWAEKSYASAREKVSSNIKEYQDKHFEKMKKLNQYEKDIQNFGMELGAEDRIREAMNNKETAKSRDTKSNSKPEPEPAPEPGPKPVPEPGPAPVPGPKKDPKSELLPPKDSELIPPKSKNLPVVKKFADRHPRLAKIPFLARFMDWVSEKVEKVKVFFRGLRGGKEENENIEENLGNIDEGLKQKGPKTEEKDRKVEEKTNEQKDSKDIDFEDIDKAFAELERLEGEYGENGRNPVAKAVGKGDEAVKDFVLRMQEGVSKEAKEGINSLNSSRETTEPTPSKEGQPEQENKGENEQESEPER